MSFTPTIFQALPRTSVRIQPTHNWLNDTTWTKGRHTVQFGVNARFIVNDRINDNNYPTYSYSRNTMKGLGADITASVTDFMRAKTGVSNLALSEATLVTNAFGTMLGIINSYNGTYQYKLDGTTVPFGQQVVRSFGNKEYEFYIQDSFKWRKDLTATYGVRYGLYPAPYERNGVQVAPTTGVDKFFAERVGASQAGIPGNAIPNAYLTFAAAGSVNGGDPYYKLDTNNFAPRLAIAWAPESDRMWGKIFGKGSVLRAGGAVTYDRYGGNMSTTFADTGSPGMATNVTQPLNTDFTDSFRYTGSGLPSLPAAPQGGFPFTPPAATGGFGSYSAVNPTLVAPYSMLLNLTYSRPLPGNLVGEVGYIGRLSRKSLLRQDYFQPLTQFLDTKSGQTWAQASGLLRDDLESGITPAAVRANSSILPTIPFFENMFPAAAGSTFGTRTAGASPTANYF